MQNTKHDPVMSNARMRLLVAQRTNKEMTDLIHERLGDIFETGFLASAAEQERKKLIETADVILAMNFRRDIRDNELSLIRNAKLIQITLAGTEMIPYDKLNPGVTICGNGGAYSEPIAEHAIGMMLTLARNFLPLHKKLSEGTFDQSTRHKMLRGATLGIVGYGGIGRRTAMIARGFGMRILAINRSGKTDDQLEFIGTLSDLDYLLRESDFLLLAIALNNKTKAIIGRKELGLMKEDAVLVNVARGELIDEADLYEHLRNHPLFKAGIEAWWIEPFNNPKFEIHYPFFELSNVLGSPHNSYLTEGILVKALSYALDNILRFVRGETPMNIQNRDDYL